MRFSAYMKIAVEQAIPIIFIRDESAHSSGELLSVSPAASEYQTVTEEIFT